MTLAEAYLTLEALKCYKEGVEEERVVLIREHASREEQIQSLEDLAVLNRLIDEYEIIMEDLDEEYEFVQVVNA